LLTGVVDENLVAGDMMLTHHWGKTTLELAIQIAEARVAVGVRMNLAVLLPQHHQIDARPLELARQCRPVWLVATPLAGLDAAASKQSLFQNLIAPLDRQRPADPGFPRSFEIVLDGAARHSERPPDLPCAYAVVMQP